MRPDRAALARVHDARERAIAALSDAFANDALDVDEFERRVTRAHTSESAEEITALTADLPASTTALRHGDGRAGAGRCRAASAAPETVYAIFGGVDRRGTWTVPRRWRVVATFGGALLDLREARFPTGVIDLEVRAVFGGVQIIVPPGLAVEVHGTAIMGGFQNVNRAPAHPDPDAPLLRIHGLAFMGGVDITMRLARRERAAGPPAPQGRVAPGAARAARRAARDAAPPARARSSARRRVVAIVHLPPLLLVVLAAGTALRAQPPPRRPPADHRRHGLGARGVAGAGDGRRAAARRCTTSPAELVARVDFRETLLDGMLSLLLFAGALEVDLDALLGEKALVGVLATVGVVVTRRRSSAWRRLLWRASAGLPLDLGEALLFGAIVSPTDPIAVIGMLRTSRAPKRLEVQMAGESLFNDAVGVVVFFTLAEVAAGPHGRRAPRSRSLFVEEVAGGAGASASPPDGAPASCSAQIDDVPFAILITLVLAIGVDAAGRAASTPPATWRSSSSVSCWAGPGTAIRSRRRCRVCTSSGRSSTRS